MPGKILEGSIATRAKSGGDPVFKLRRLSAGGGCAALGGLARLFFLFDSIVSALHGVFTLGDLLREATPFLAKLVRLARPSREVLFVTKRATEDAGGSLQSIIGSRVHAKLNRTHTTDD